MFFIETKFISKLFKKFRRQNGSQEIPRLRLFIFSWKIHRISSKIIKHNSKKWKFKITDNVFKSMGGRNLGLGTYPSQNARLLYYFLHLSLKIGPTVADQYSTWTNGELWGLAIEKWLSKCWKIMKSSKSGVCMMKSTFDGTQIEQKK